MTITTANTTIANKNVLGRIIVKAANVKLENTIVHGEQSATTHTVAVGLIDATDNAVVNLEISNVEVVPTIPSEWTVGFDGHDANIQKSYFHNVMDGMRLRNGPDGSSDMLVQRNRIKDLTYYVVPDTRAKDRQTHNDGIQLAGAKNAVISWNNISAYYSTTAGQDHPAPNETHLLWAHHFSPCRRSC